MYAQRTSRTKALSRARGAGRSLAALDGVPAPWMPRVDGTGGSGESPVRAPLRPRDAPPRRRWPWRSAQHTKGERVPGLRTLHGHSRDFFKDMF